MKISSSKFRNVSLSEQKDIFNRIYQGDLNARNMLIERMMPIVEYIAAGYTNNGLPIEDLMGEGALGIVHAIDRFKPEYDFPFAAYAVLWIKIYIIKAICDNGWQIHIPSDVQSLMNKIKKQIDLTMQTEEREPSADELAEALHEPVNAITQCLDAMLLQVSLDAPLLSDGNSDIQNVFIPVHAAHLVPVSKYPWEETEILY